MDEVKEAPLSPQVRAIEGDWIQSSPKPKHDGGIMLIPQPSDDPRDPLNWPMAKKLGIVAVLCLAVFSGFAAALAGQLNVKSQAALYKQTTTHIAWQNCLASAGFASGGFFFAPVSFKIGRSATIFWTLIACMLCQVWAAEMSHRNQFKSFIISRFFSGFFGGVTGVLGPRVLVDLFFLHQRGRAFTAFHWCLNFGSMAGPTLSAFVAANRSWTLEYWWTVALVGLAATCCFLFMHETSWARDGEAINPPAMKRFLSNRFATFFPGTRVTPKSSTKETLRTAAIPFLIMVSPVTLIMSVFTLIGFGFYIAMNALTPVFLQKPVKIGGYGFSLIETAYFSFSHWIGIIFALAYGHFISDRLPLYICARRSGIWAPEYRLHALWFPALICNPIGLGIFGAALQYHMSWAVLALGMALVTFGSLAMIPICVNYMCESFVRHPGEASITANCLRLLFGLTVPFYINEWVAEVSVGWTYGMMAIFDVLAFGFVVLLMWKGKLIREWTVGGLNESEDGEKVIETASEDEK